MASERGNAQKAKHQEANFAAIMQLVHQSRVRNKTNDALAPQSMEAAES